jgi:thiamine biosynthesis protein ThiS
MLFALCPLQNFIIMKIILNNREESFDFEQMTIAKIMEIKKFTFSKIIVKVNGEFIEKEDYAATIVVDGDVVLILHLLAGG